jgi:hypothetical protein
MALTKIQGENIANSAITVTKISNTVALSNFPKISNVAIANSTYHVQDDTAVNIGGGYIVITGSNFLSGAIVLVDGTTALSTTFVNSTTLHAEIDSANAATYNLYVVNPTGETGLKLNAVTHSQTPIWSTGETLNTAINGLPFNITLSAGEGTSFTNTTALPAGTTLLSNGYLYGTITGESPTNYTITIRSTDAQNQKVTRTFTLPFIVSQPPTSVEYLVVAGGGGGGTVSTGGWEGAGGGGAGGLLTGNVSVSTSTEYSVVVGGGGGGNAQGSTSSFAGVSTVGGGYGMGGTSGGGGSGGSGGGGRGYGGAKPGGAGTAGPPRQGYDGGTGFNGSNPQRGGGGGGAGAVGGPGNANSGGDGGVGLQIFGTYYAGGGGGGPGGPGGQGGGGNATPNNSGNGTAGTTNTGGGGGGAGKDGGTGGSGGSGIVIIRYPDSDLDAASTTGSPTYSNSGGYKTYTFTGSGSITW